MHSALAQHIRPHQERHAVMLSTLAQHLRPHQERHAAMLRTCSYPCLQSRAGRTAEAEHQREQRASPPAAMEGDQHHAQQKETHVLLVSIPSQGHLNPMLDLARRLSLLGLRPTVATLDIARQRILLRSSSTHTSSPVSFSFFSDGLPPSFDRSNDLPTFFHHLRVHSSSHLDHLISSSPHPFSLVVTTQFFPWASQVALRHRLPCALLWIQPFTLFSLFHRDPATIPATLPFVADLFRELFTESLKNTNWVLANSFRELENQPAIESPPVLFVGPLASSSFRTELDMWEVDDSCMEWLDEREKDGSGSVVYVAFGSLARPSPALVRGLADALEASGHHYLWVAKDYDVAGGERGKVVGWCEQRKVLEHRAVGCFVSHCGWNSVLEAVAAGVPVVGMPQFGDQHTNAGLVEAWVMGVKVGEVEEVGTKIREVIGNEEMRRTARELKEKARRAAGEGGSSFDNLRRFVDEVKGRIVHSQSEVVKKEDPLEQRGSPAVTQGIRWMGIGRL